MKLLASKTTDVKEVIAVIDVWYLPVGALFGRCNDWRQEQQTLKRPLLFLTFDICWWERLSSRDIKCRGDIYDSRRIIGKKNPVRKLSMTTIQPQGEDLRKAVKWISEEQQGEKDAFPANRGGVFEIWPVTDGCGVFTKVYAKSRINTRFCIYEPFNRKKGIMCLVFRV